MTLGQNDHHRRAIGTPAAFGLGCGLALGVLLATPPAVAADRAPKPMLSISMDNGGTTADVGDTLDYTIIVENTGAGAVTDLRVTQTMPEGLSFESADRGGAAARGMVVWSVDLAAGRTRELQATMTVGETPDEVLRLASVACASLSSKKAPLVCATHSDELAAGRAARLRGEAASAGATGSTVSWIDTAPMRIALLGGVVAIVGLAVVGVRRRWRRLVTAGRTAVRRR